MKYSVEGSLAIDKENAIVGLLNQYTLWRLFTEKETKRHTGQTVFTFKVWLNSIGQMASLYEQLKWHVTNKDEFINWHECTHDEEVQQPCRIVDEYRGG